MEAKEKLERFSREVMRKSLLASEADAEALETGEGVTFIRVILVPDCPRFRGHSLFDSIP